MIQILNTRFPRSHNVVLSAAIWAVISALMVISCSEQTASKWSILYFKGANDTISLKIKNGKLLSEGVTLELWAKLPTDFTEIEVVFPNKTKALPVGVIIFKDFTVLPGRLTLEVDGSKIDLMSRALLIDGVEFQWSKLDGTTIRISELQGVK